MAYIRVAKHYLHLPFLVLGLVEFCALAAAVVVSYTIVGAGSVGVAMDNYLPPLLFALILSCCTLSMGVYAALVGEGFSSMALRTLVSYCLLGSVALFITYLLFPVVAISQNVLFWSVIGSTALVFAIRAVFLLLVDTNKLKRNVVILGAGQRAADLLRALGAEKALNINIVGCIPAGGAEQSEVPESRHLLQPQEWENWVLQNRISEIVVAPDERRRAQGGVFPLLELVGCKLKGVQVTELLTFYERELSKVHVGQLHPSWMLFSDGFKYSKGRDFTKRSFDIAISLALLAVLWPFMLFTAVAVALESGFPVLYRQTRVGHDGKPFSIYKFRSMRKDAEKGGKAVWATKNDSRVTKVGAFIRNTRLDELPQLYNVIRGDMSFVGPRPERPEFVEDLKEKIPYYDIRHKVKPGLMGWAQLKYPYGASVEDARNKLQYDLYYTKNHSFLMDLLIMIQTVEVVLLGKGVH